ncbi:TetR/AcrR family transcriptional regulator [Paucilactobacillus suebicus]|uniref:Transcription regulator n=1 Tax=Paucilactobacillus suebicus DSM 5007 = KCTC 3549 TaxID=1423807 RepID=A0A0R1VVZ3_9LACO|nr:TetR/AcrR family transcriptional regulator [Paucilactobacillus suebicus]KRM09902.1 transcription regulator [Paucilactobacillus suebicus DSM 5007 = KCTC 3549]
MRKKDDQKTEQIIEAASQVILSNGAAALSTTQVAKKVGISQSNIYIYFKNKNDLLFHVYLAQLAVLRPIFDDALNSNLNTATLLQRYITTLYQFALNHDDRLTIIDQIKHLANSPLKNTGEDPDNDRQYARQLIMRGINDGTLRNVDPSIHLSIVFNTVRKQASIVRNSSDDISFEPVLDMIWSAISNPKTD